MAAAKKFTLNDGTPITLREISDRTGLSTTAVAYRVHTMGMTPEEILERGDRYGRREKYTLDGVGMLREAISGRLHLHFTQFYVRARAHGTTVQQEIDAEFERQTAGKRFIAGADE